MRLLLGLFILFCSGISSAEVDQPGGLILNFHADSQLNLTSVAVTSRVASPRSIAGPAWTVVAADRSGAVLWTRAFPAPRAFDGVAAEGLGFSIAIPRVLDAVLTIRDEHDEVRWSQIVDSTLLGAADAMSANVARNLDSAYAATARLQSTTIRAPLLRQLEFQPAAGASRPQPVDSLQSAALGPARNLLTQGASGTSTYAVTGTVTDAGPILVRAIDAVSGRFVVSTRQEWFSQHYELPLAAGTYVFEYDDNLENIGSDFFYRTPTRTPPIRIAGDTQLPPITRDSAAGEFSLLARVPCALVAQNTYLAAYIEVRAADGTHIERGAKLDSTSAQDASGLCAARYLIQLSPGMYTIQASPLGWEPRRLGVVQIVAGQRAEQAATFAGAERTMVWRGVVVDSANIPLSGAIVVAEDQLQDVAWAPWPDAAGHFEIPYRKDWVFEFHPSPWTANASYVRRVYAMDGTPPPPTVVIDDLALDSVIDDGLIRFYGTGEREKHFNILFLAEGFTDLHETFTDANGNGVWDGFLWYDLDKDGVYSNPDHVQAYGSLSSYPEIGSIPTADNEPFTDLNGDGILSLDDPALFMVNARDFMRLLLGSDFWSEHRDAFNAYALFEPSEQAGYSIYSASGEQLVSRSTRYHASLDLTRNLLSVDRAAATARALAALPEVDLVVVLVNDPVFARARASASRSLPGTLIYPAPAYARSWRDMTPSHEVGHSIGSLCDEYEEFPGVNPASGTHSIWCPNASYSPSVADVPWAKWLPRVGLQVPTRNLDTSIGIYEGADYYPGGAYRPSYRSTMRDLSMLFNAPSRAALLKAVQSRTGNAPAAPPRDRTPAFVPLPSNQIRYSHSVRP